MLPDSWRAARRARQEIETGSDLHAQRDVQVVQVVVNPALPFRLAERDQQDICRGSMDFLDQPIVVRARHAAERWRCASRDAQVGILRLQPLGGCRGNPGRPAQKVDAVVPAVGQFGQPHDQIGSGDAARQWSSGPAASDDDREPVGQHSCGPRVDLLQLRHLVGEH